MTNHRIGGSFPPAASSKPLLSELSGAQTQVVTTDALPDMWTWFPASETGISLIARF